MSRAGNRDLLAAGTAALALHAGVIAIGAWLAPNATLTPAAARTPMEVVLESAPADAPARRAQRMRPRAAAPLPAASPPPAPTVRTTALPASAPAGAPGLAAPHPSASPAPASVTEPPPPRPPAPPLAPTTVPPLAVDTPSISEPVGVAALPDDPTDRGGRTAPSPATGNERPRYPRVARQRGYEGTVELRVHVLASGTPDRVEVARSSGHDVLDRAAVRAAKRWRFHPAMERGRAVDTWVELPIEFDLTDDGS